MPKINSLLDARSLTNYGPACQVDADLMKQLGTQNTRDFKIALMNNGANIIANQNQMITSHIQSLAYGPYLG
jgi:hypothetical protein